MRKKIFAVISALGWASLGWMAHDFYEGRNDAPANPGPVAAQPAASSASGSRAASPVQADGSVVLATIPRSEMTGLMNTGAQKGAALNAITDEQSLCALVKDNALKTNPAAYPTATAEFESCANRTLHFDAAFLQAGAVFGAELANMKGGDLCAVYKIASTRAAMKYTLEAGQAVPAHDTTMENVNKILESCLGEGEYGASNDSWNSYVNQAVILPFYKKEDAQTQAPAAAPASGPSAAPTTMFGG
jgi:hypothetical protein